MPDEPIIPTGQQNSGQSAPAAPQVVASIINEAPVGQPIFKQGPRSARQGTGNGILFPAAAIILIVVIIAGAYLFVTGPKTSTSTTTTTVPASMFAITGCRSINASGSYHLASNVMTSMQSGVCINITANDVSLSCGQQRVVGSGPYSGVPPYTYGIEVSGRSNVSISGCTVKNFSYGIYSTSSANVSISRSNITTNYLSNIYLSNTRGSDISDNRMSGSASMQGSLYISNGSEGNRFYNNTILRNQYYGIYVNSSLNTFIDNHVNTTPVSFYCNARYGFKTNNTANSNLCYNNTGCGFLQCHGVNLPVNLSQIELGRSIRSCGAIDEPGEYSLSSGIDMGSLVDVNSALRYGVPCITIDSSSVALDCRNLGITNSSIGISAINATGVTISNCSVTDSNTGISLSGVASSGIYNATMHNDSIGVMLNNSGADTLSDVKAYGGINGTYLLDSPSDTFRNFNFSDNRYGVYMSNSIGETFSAGTAVNNSKLDVYSTPDSAGAGYSLMQLTECGVTNAEWATCRQHITANLSYSPISSCMVASRSGNYTLTANLINAQPNCIDIEASNVAVDCASHLIDAAAGVSGPAFYINDRENVTISKCNIIGFTSSVSAYNSSNVSVEGVRATNGYYGVLFHNVSGGSVMNTTIAGTLNASISLTDSRNVSIIADNITGTPTMNIGIYLSNSVRNNVLNNNMSADYVGIYITGASYNNTVSDNYVRSSTSYDYYCNGNSGINSEFGGINYGTKKSGCHWLAMLMKASPLISCSAALQPDTFFLSNDQMYNFNATCYSVYAPGTEINCNGHTIASTNGGTFAMFKNSANGYLHNCFLKGFATPIIIINSSSIVVMNNTVYMNGTGTAINVSRAQAPKIQENNITSRLGVNITDSFGGYLLNNMVYGADSAYRFGNVSSFSVQNNTAARGSRLGLYMTNSTINWFSNNNFSTAGTGLQCAALSRGNTSNIDNGGNICSSSSGCSWIKGSVLTCHG